MDLQTLYWFGAAIVAGMTIFNTVMTVGRKSGATDAQLANNQAHLDAAEKAWATKFDALYSSFSLHQAQTSERFERVVERLNEALLMMAREHPTKADLQEVKREILERIDSQEPARRIRKP
jgi:hypothetical protein